MHRNYHLFKRLLVAYTHTHHPADCKACPSYSSVSSSALSTLSGSASCRRQRNAMSILQHCLFFPLHLVGWTLKACAGYNEVLLHAFIAQTITKGTQGWIQMMDSMVLLKVAFDRCCHTWRSRLSVLARPIIPGELAPSQMRIGLQHRKSETVFSY